MTDQDKKGFTVTDRRVKPDQEAKDAPSPAKPETEKKTEPQNQCAEPFPEMTFASFLISLNTSALMHLGLLPDLSSGQVQKNFELAKQTIDLLGLLKEKTKGNLSQEEQDLLDNLLLDLRLKFVELCK